ncbi:MAG: nucleotidyltransferase domain-containing protein [Chloroflexi bacterium]|nr:nucleotidyltransferase domain-containing protein [Chloroflexota bacterium]MCI0577976.1 nucleotidyltransferase domain-containing protein [Chloroflexota bacterium]MCI0646658.1 nucleotidyltransferase domain-containing protein [Chloroflexota bacterium]MCI0729238.1 nucleotidyltransferase domain-containing protein [Chloroflexota bacterium]
MTLSPHDRQTTLDRLLAALQTDNRIAGALLVGSAATGFNDDLSDIDLSVVVAQEAQVTAVFHDWQQRIPTLFPVIHSFEATYGPNNFLVAFWLETFLELDLGFLCLANLVAKRDRWQVAFDRSGRIESLMRASWAGRPAPDVQALYLATLDSLWHYAGHVAISVQRRHFWRALHYLDEIRDRTITLAGLRRQLDTRHFRQVDRLPPELLARLEQTLISQVTAGLTR